MSEEIVRTELRIVCLVVRVVYLWILNLISQPACVVEGMIGASEYFVAQGVNLESFVLQVFEKGFFVGNSDMYFTGLHRINRPPGVALSLLLSSFQSR